MNGQSKLFTRLDSPQRNDYLSEKKCILLGNNTVYDVITWLSTRFHCKIEEVGKIPFNIGGKKLLLSEYYFL